MYIQNTARRLITINAKQVLQHGENGGVRGAKPGTKYKLMLPKEKGMTAGAPTDVPNDVCVQKSTFLYALLEANDVKFDKAELDELVNPKADNITDTFKGMTKDELVVMAEVLDIEVDSKWTKADLIAAIEAAQSAA